MGKLGIPNIYELFVYQTVNLIFKVKNNTMPEAFPTKFKYCNTNTRQDIEK